LSQQKKSSFLKLFVFQVVRNDRLLTDSVYERRPSSQQLCNSNNNNSFSAACHNQSQQQLLHLQQHQLHQQQLHSQFPTSGPVKSEHSYSLGLLNGAVGSDGDSLPDSPLSIAEGQNNVLNVLPVLHILKV
jgi:hypothetical protein